MTPQQNEDPEAQAQGTDGRGAESPPADVQNTGLPGAATELNADAATEVSLPDGVTNDPAKPAAVAAMAKPPEFGDQKVPTGPTRASIADQDRREMLEKKAPPKGRNPLSEAVGDEFYVTNDTKPSWVRPRGGQFRVSRHYIHQKVAVDFLDNSRQMANDAAVKQEVLNTEGVVFIAIGPRQAFTMDEVQDMIADQRKQIASKGESDGGN